jgi:hypothetical protein
MAASNNQTVADEWVSFPGGELEGKRPKAMCPACRDALKRAAASAAPAPSRPRPLCFQCYRAELDRERALAAAGNLDTASAARYQTTLPFEPVNTLKLEMLKAERAAAREASSRGIGQFDDRRRRAQIAARHALQAIFAGVRARQAAATIAASAGASGAAAAGAARRDAEGIIASAIHAAELQLPEAWLPFVVSQ